jgi:hypothetical protein
VLRQLFHEIVRHVAHLRSASGIFHSLYFFLYIILGIIMQVPNNCCLEVF